MSSMIQFIQKIALLSPTIVLPFIALAADPNNQQVDTVLDNIRQDLNSVIGILTILATLVFIWGVILFITSAGDPSKHADGRQYMIWGIVALAVIGAAWAVANVIIVYFMGDAGTGPVEVIPPPAVPGVAPRAR